MEMKQILHVRAVITTAEKKERKQMMKQVTVTGEGLKKMKEELDYLKNVRRKEVSDAIGVARSFGDLSENSEYDEAKNEQAKVEAEIAELEDNIKTCRCTG